MPWSSQYIAELNTTRVHPGARKKKKNLTRICLHHGESSTDKNDGTDADFRDTGGGPRGTGHSGTSRRFRGCGLGHGGTSRRFRGRGSRRHGGFLGDAAGNAGVGLIDLGLTASERCGRLDEGDMPPVVSVVDIICPGCFVDIICNADLAAWTFHCAISFGGSFHAKVAVTGTVSSCVDVIIIHDQTFADGGAREHGASLGSRGGCCLAVYTEPKKRKKGLICRAGKIRFKERKAVEQSKKANK